MEPVPVVPVPSLLDALRAVPDHRYPRGRRHPLPAVLALAVVAMLCDRDSLRGIARWGREQGADIAATLGFTRTQTPCLATLHRVFRGLDATAFERAVSAWVAAAAGATGAAIPLTAIAVDGKTLRGSRGAGLPAVQLLSAFGHELGTTLAQVPIDPTAGEQAAAPALLAEVVLTGRVVTLDALHTQRATAALIVAKGGTM